MYHYSIQFESSLYKNSKVLQSTIYFKLETDMKEIAIRGFYFLLGVISLCCAATLFEEEGGLLFSVVSLVLGVISLCSACCTAAVRRRAYGGQYPYALVLVVVVVVIGLLALVVYFFGYKPVLWALVLIAVGTYVTCLLFDKSVYPEAGVDPDQK